MLPNIVIVPEFHNFITLNNNNDDNNKKKKNFQASAFYLWLSHRFMDVQVNRQLCRSSKEMWVCKKVPAAGYSERHPKCIPVIK